MAAVADASSGGTKRKRGSGHGAAEEAPAKKSKKSKSSKKSTKDVTAPTPMAPVTKVNDEPPAPVVEWSEDEKKTLVSRIKAALPAEDLFKYTTGKQKLDWDRIAFDNHTKDECMKQWDSISSKIRHFRTLTDIVKDAEVYLVSGVLDGRKKKKAAHPDLPKKPLTPFFRFFLDKREKFKTAHPSLSSTDISKLLSEKYKDLPERKKQRYQAAFKKEQTIYKLECAQFHKDNPDFNNAGVSKKPPTCPTPSGLYISHHIDQALKTNSQASRKELYEMYKKKWGEASVSKKMSYIKKALVEKESYITKMDEYCLAHPNYVRPPVKCLNKDEQSIKDNYDGKPGKPPANGYALFTSETLKSLNHVPNKERMTEVGKKWKDLTEPQQQEYTKLAEVRMTEYKQRLQNYYNGLSEEDKKKHDEEALQKKNAKSAVKVAPGSPKSAFDFFVIERQHVIQEQNPSHNKDKVKKQLIREYQGLSDLQKTRYKQLEDETKIKAEEAAKDARKPVKTVKGLFPGEPKKPVGSGYQLFSAELLNSAQLQEVTVNERMAVIAKRWKALPDKTKVSYKMKRDKLVEIYEKQIETFKQSLSPETLAKYEEHRFARDGPKKVKKDKANKTPVTMKNESEDAATAAANAVKTELESADDSDDSSSCDDSSSSDDSSDDSGDGSDDSDDSSDDDDDSGDDDSSSSSDDSSSDDDSDDSGDDDDDEDEEEANANGDVDDDSSDGSSESDSDSSDDDSSSDEE